MFVARGVKTDHKDLIHDVAFDYYGTRMATCSSDQTVRVWELDAQEGNWNCTASWKAHSGSVWKVTWANPEYGQVIATCSFDRTAAVWEEVVGEGSIGDRISATHWVKRTTLVDSRTSVTDVKFAPRYLGLVLATCSADGFVRIYEAPDVMNLTQWSLQYEIPVKLSCSCIAWNPTYPRHFAPMIAVGTDDSTVDVPKVMIYEFNENLRRWNRIESLKDITDPVNDLSFAPNLGRSHHLLGVATKDLKVVSLEPSMVEDENQVPSSNKVTIRTIAQCPDHNSTVWRVAWNVTGTILASSGDDGCVRLWKGNYMGNWRCVSILRGDGTQANAEPTSAAASATSPVGSFGNSRFMKLGAAAALKQDVVWH
ncbi:unnamed protein product [Orchesella dallaii]|uniref:Nucleoporin SEH1 n=1 Tax=Orchesella dallaii TaxID=48710 RepID=A0ABP1QQH8_9HEXA